MFKGKGEAQQDGRRDKIVFRIKPHTHQRCLEGSKQNFVHTRTQGPHKSLSQTCLWVFECLLRRHESAVACLGDRGSGCSRYGRSGMQAQSQRHRTNNQQTGGQLRQRNSWIVVNVLGSTANFPIWGSGKETENPQGIWLDGQWDLIAELPQDWGNKSLGEHKPNFVPTRTQGEGAVTPQETEPDLSVSVQESPVEAWACSGLSWGQRHWIQQSWYKYFWRELLLPLSVFCLRLAAGREHSPTHQQKIGLKIYWAWPCPSEQEPDSPIASLHPQEASRSLLSLSIRGRQDGNHSYRRLTKLFTWITDLSNSMKLWAMPYKATQNGQVMVKSFNKMWSTGEENGKLHQYSHLENPMNSVKRKKQKIWPWKMN